MAEGSQFKVNIFQVDSGRLFTVACTAEHRVGDLKVKYRQSVFDELKRVGQLPQQFPNLVFFTQDGGILHDGEIVADHQGKNKKSGTIFMYNLSVIGDETQWMVYSPIANIEDYNTHEQRDICDDVREELKLQLEGLAIAEKSLQDKLTHDLSIVNRATDLLEGKDGQDFSILSCGESLPKLFQSVPVDPRIHQLASQRHERDSSAPVESTSSVNVMGAGNLYDCLKEDPNNDIDFTIIEKTQQERIFLLKNLKELKTELKNIQHDAKPLSDFDQIQNVADNSRSSSPAEEFAILTNAKQQCCRLFLQRIKLISKCQRRLRSNTRLHHSYDDIALRVNKVKHISKKLQRWSKMPMAYVGALDEIRRQRAFTEGYVHRLSELQVRVEKLRIEEVERRKQFMRTHGKFLPDWNEFYDLSVRPRNFFKTFDTTTIGGNDVSSLPNVSSDMVREATNAVKPQLLASLDLRSATGWEENDDFDALYRPVCDLDDVFITTNDPRTSEQISLLQELLVGVNAECGGFQLKNSQLEQTNVDLQQSLATTVSRLVEQSFDFSAAPPSLEVKGDGWSETLDTLTQLVQHQQNKIDQSKLKYTESTRLQQTIAELQQQIDALLLENVALAKLKQLSVTKQAEIDRLRANIDEMHSSVSANAKLETETRQLQHQIEQQQQHIEQQQQQIDQLNQLHEAHSRASEEQKQRQISSEATDTDDAVDVLISTKNFEIGNFALFQPWNNKTANQILLVAYEYGKDSEKSTHKYFLDPSCYDALGHDPNNTKKLIPAIITEIHSATQNELKLGEKYLPYHLVKAQRASESGSSPRTLSPSVMTVSTRVSDGSSASTA
eukprot:m.195192 g.195192  ORF g.195192 m.195192 type:complete len:839 (-) comp32553_c0_seq1:105-2621(-)